MDAGHLTQIFVFAGATVAVGRFVVTTFGKAEGGIAALFVPPDQTLGWPRGVQESDEHWGWHPGIPPATEVFDAAGDEPGRDDRGGPPAEAPLPTGRFVVEPAPVAPIRFRTRPH